MASNKNQHFVPRCYLKPFSVGPSFATINLLNIDRLRFIESAPIKHQCSGNYFYGQDPQLEKALQTTEGAYANVLGEIIQPGYQLSDNHRSLLRRFWLLQRMRTEAASTRAIELITTMGHAAGVPPEEFRMNIREAVQDSMRLFATEMYSVDDLKICLLRNRTALPFVTSDDPAVLTNRWQLESPRTKGKSFGLQSAGALLLLPLTPQILCLGYDGDVYSIPHEKGWVEVKRESDVFALNQHQFFNCLANIFVQDPAHRELIRDAFMASAPLRSKVRHRLNYAVLEAHDGDSSIYRVVEQSNAPEHQQALLHVQTIHAHPSAWPKQVQWRTNGSVYSNGTGVGYVRRGWLDRVGGPPFAKERSH